MAVIHSRSALEFSYNLTASVLAYFVDKIHNVEEAVWKHGLYNGDTYPSKQREPC